MRSANLPLSTEPIAVAPSHHFGVDRGARLDRARGRQLRALDQPLEIERLGAVRVGRAVDAASHHHFDARRCPGHRHRLLEDRDHAVLAACRLLVVVVHIRLGVAHQRRIVGELLRRHRVELFLSQAEAVLDRVAACGDRVLLPLAAEDVARRLLVEAMGFIDQRLQHRQRIGHDVAHLARRRERIGTRRIELDPIRALADLIAHRRACLIGRRHDRGGERIVRPRIRCTGPDDPARRHLHPRSVDQALVEGVPHIDVGIAVAVARHVAQRGETRAQIGLRVLDRDHRRHLARDAVLGVVEDVRMGVDQPRQHRLARQVDDLGACGNPHLRGGPDLADALAVDQHHLVGQHLAGVAVEQAAGADRDRARRFGTFQRAAVDPETRLRTCAPPGHARPDLRALADPACRDGAEDRRRCHQCLPDAHLILPIVSRVAAYVWIARPRT